MNKIILLSLSTVLLTGCFSKQLPKCDDAGAVEVLKSAIADTPAFKLLGINRIEIKDISERPSTTSEKRVCRGSMNLGNELGTQVIYYSIDWQNKENDEYWVQTIESE